MRSSDSVDATATFVISVLSRDCTIGLHEQCFWHGWQTKSAILCDCCCHYPEPIPYAVTSREAP